MFVPCDNNAFIYIIVKTYISIYTYYTELKIEPKIVHNNELLVGILYVWIIAIAVWVVYIFSYLLTNMLHILTDVEGSQKNIPCKFWTRSD